MCKNLAAETRMKNCRFILNVIRDHTFNVGLVSDY